jgi:hypothetical protein
MYQELVFIFSLKGWDNLAQGNALGMMAVCCSSLKGWDNKPISKTVAPFQGALCYRTFPRAMPWAKLSQPFRLKKIQRLISFREGIYTHD